MFLFTMTIQQSDNTTQTWQPFTYANVGEVTARVVGVSLKDRKTKSLQQPKKNKKTSGNPGEQQYEPRLLYQVKAGTLRSVATKSLPDTATMLRHQRMTRIHRKISKLGYFMIIVTISNTH